MTDLAAPAVASVLIVDDTPANLRLLANILAERGHVVHAANGAAAALRFLQATPPDLVLLDIRMPGMDGYEVCARLKRDERTRDVPVIFISAADQPHDKVQAFAAGGVDYVVKPFHPEEVLARVHTHLALRALRTDLEALVARRTADLRRTQALLQGIIDHSAALITVKDAEGRYLLTNRRFETVFNAGARLSAATGATDFDLFPPETARRLRADDLAVLARGGTLESEHLMPTAGGERSYLAMRTVLHGVTERASVCCIATDITERVQAERMLRQLNAMLESRVAERGSAGN